MAAYIVLSPNGRPQDPDCRFVRDGFSWLAAIFPVIHALVHGVFLDALILLIVQAVGFTLLAAPQTSGIGFILLAASSLIYGFEARVRLSERLMRRGWKAEHVITATSLAEAEAIHYGEDDTVLADNPISKLETGTARSPYPRPAQQFGLIDFQKGR